MLELSLASDFYAFKAADAYINEGIHTKEVEFDFLFGKLPQSFGYAVLAGLDEVCEFIEKLRFADDDIEFLLSAGAIGRGLADYLKSFCFSGTLKAVPEGSVVFAGEPILTVRAPLVEATLVESGVLRIINSRSAVATAASRTVSAARGLPIIEMGSRRAHGADSAVFGARAAYVGGVSATTCTLSGKSFDIPLAAVMPHSFVQSHEYEYTAFEKWINQSMGPTILTADTYDTLSCGIDNIIGVLSNLSEKQSISAMIRIDSGDVAYLAGRVRQKLDRAGLESCRIMASGELDEKKIRALVDGGAPIDCFGVGEGIITPAFSLGGVYKLAAIEENGVMKPQIKLGESFGRVTLPGVKKLLRFYDKRSGKAIADEVCIEDEHIPTQRHTLFDPHSTWKTKELVNFDVRDMLETVIANGERVSQPRTLREIRDYHARELDTLCSDVRSLDPAGAYYVDLSEKLWTLRRRMTGAKRSAFFVR